MQHIKLSGIERIMVFFACGLNHKTAPIDIREKIALPTALQHDVLHELVGLSSIHEAAILSTCNRTEIYCDADDPKAIINWLSKEQALDAELFLPHVYLHHGPQGIKHTLRVASGLDSMMLGEPQILGQMKHAFNQACEAGTVKKNLRSVFEYVFSASKRIRTQSGIGSNPVSVAYAAVQLISQRFTDYKSLRVLLIGSGETATLVAKYLYKLGVKEFKVASRTLDNAKILAASFHGEALNILDIPDSLKEADIVISATACPLPFINTQLVEDALKARANAPMFFLDLAVPRDIESQVGELDFIDLYNIDDLQSMTEQGMNERRSAALQAEQLIDRELENYIRKHRATKANSLITEYRHQMLSLAKQELSRSRLKLSNGQDQEAVLQEFCHRLLNKVMHNPTEGLRQAAEDGREELLQLTHYLYNTAEDSIPL